MKPDFTPQMAVEIPTIEKPNILPKIPEFIREKLTNQEVALLQSISVVEQQGAWTIERIVEIYSLLEKLSVKMGDEDEERQKSRDRWLVLRSWKTVVGGFFVLIIVPMIPDLLKWLWHLKFP